MAYWYVWRCLIVAPFFCIAVEALGEDFTQFRGPSGQGIVSAQPIALEWSSETNNNIAWQAAVPGSGWSQPVVFGARIYVTAAVSPSNLRPKNFADGVKTPQSMGLNFFSSPPKEKLEWKVYCIDTASGQTVWDQTVDSGQPKFAIHPSNSYATESPVVDTNGVYVYFGATGKLAGLSLDGETRWQKDIGVFKTSNSFGTGSSLAIRAGKIYAQNFSQESADLYCFDTLSGDQVWKISRNTKETSWSSPILWDNELRSELVVSGGEEVNSFDPDTGANLWTLRNVKAATACSVCFDKQRIYFGGSDPFSTGPLFAVSSGASGEITPEKKNKEFEHCDWIAERAAPGMASPVSNGELVYVVDKNILRCYDASSGERLFQERLPKLEMVNASPLIVGDKLILIDENGTTAIVQVGKTLEVVGTGKLEDTVWATPAVSNAAIFIRGVNALYCIRPSSN